MMVMFFWKIPLFKSNSRLCGDAPTDTADVVCTKRRTEKIVSIDLKASFLVL
jgi:hypothetical protein